MSHVTTVFYIGKNIYFYYSPTGQTQIEENIQPPLMIRRWYIYNVTHYIVFRDCANNSPLGKQRRKPLRYGRFPGLYPLNRVKNS